MFPCWMLLPWEPLAHFHKVSTVVHCPQYAPEQLAEGPCYHPVPLTMMYHPTGKPYIIALLLKSSLNEPCKLLSKDPILPLRKVENLRKT